METSSGESTPSKQNRSSLGRSAMPRRSTRGPLDISQGPVSTTPSPTPSTSQTPLRSTSSHLPIALSTYTTAQAYPTKEFPKLLRPEIYHPLTYLTTPSAFRTSATQPSPATPLSTLLATGHFRAAAIAAAQALTTSTSPSDYPAIFSLLYTRLACLTLCGSPTLAAQEATALEDLNSASYRDDATGIHLVPWDLRVLAVRLQSVGFNDPRQGIMGYYDLARQARAELSKLQSQTFAGDIVIAERNLWEERLADLGLRVASALVEMEDLEGATRHLAVLSEHTKRQSQTEGLNLQKALLYLRIGDVVGARSCISSHHGSETDNIITALSDMADGDYTGAVEAWRYLCNRDAANSMYTQNLAVCLLYAGRISEARTHLQSLVHDGSAFHALTFNLCTIYELCTDKSRALKTALSEEVANLSDMDGLGWEKGAVDFKL